MLGIFIFGCIIRVVGEADQRGIQEGGGQADKMEREGEEIGE